VDVCVFVGNLEWCVIPRKLGSERRMQLA